MQIPTFCDENDNKISFYVNDKDELYLEVSANGDDVHETRFVCLDKEDLMAFISHLQRLSDDVI